MTKKRASLEAFAQVGAAPATSNVVELKQPVEEEAPRARKDRPHTTLYIGKKAQKVIKEIALQYDCKPHNLYIEGLNLMLAKYGKPPISEIEK